MPDDAPLALPDWLVAELPPVQPHGRVDVAGETAVVYTSPDGVSATYDSVPAAYEALRGLDLEFSSALVRREDGFEGMLTFPSDDSAYYGAWFGHSDESSRHSLVDNYRDSLSCAQRYRETEGADFLAAFRYLDQHPAFWLRRERDSWHWETIGHMNRVEIEAWQDEDGGTCIGLETGKHTPDLTEHYHDPYLDAVGATFEDAVLALAHNVAVTFNDDGTETGERPANPEADELYATLRERMDPRE